MINYFKSKEKEYPDYLNEIYSHTSVYLLNYQKDKDIKVSYGTSPKINNTEIHHYCYINKGSSGAPILLINNQKLIGINYCSSKNFKYNKGTLLIYSIIELKNIKNNKLLINKKGKLIENKDEIINI